MLGATAPLTPPADDVVLPMTIPDTAPVLLATELAPVVVRPGVVDVVVVPETPPVGALLVVVTAVVLLDVVVLRPVVVIRVVDVVLPL